MKKNFIRIIPKLDIKNGQLIKGINLEGLRILGDPFKFAQHYYKSQADEICYIDNVATLYGTNNLSSFVSRTACNIFIPLSVGGGIRTIKDIERMLKSGADKVCINSAAVNNINFLKKATRMFGSSTITVIIEYVKIGKKYFISKSTGRDLENINPLDWAKRVEDFGAGEILLTSINNEGIKMGFDTKVIKKISKSVNIPVVAHGGAGNLQHIYEVIKNSNISGVALSGLLHYDIAHIFKYKRSSIGNFSYLENLEKKIKPANNLLKIKKFLKKKGLNVRI
jgi:cyclase